MSAAKDEAENGHLDLNIGGEGTEGKDPRAGAEDAGPDDDMPTPRLGHPNGVWKKDGDNESTGRQDRLRPGEDQNLDLESEDSSSIHAYHQDPGRPSSADGSLSIPDDSPSAPSSRASFSPQRGSRMSGYGKSPTPSLRPFDRRFQARVSSSPTNTPRTSSPVFLNIHSRNSSANYSISEFKDIEPPQAPWEVVRWTKLRKMTGHAFSEVGKRNFGRPTCIAIAASIAIGTSKGVILVFDYNQNLKSIIGPATQAVESGPVTSISISADHSTIAGGHASGSIYTWEVAKPAKPFLHIPPIDRNRTPNVDGHVKDVAVLHLGFLGIRHTALASADDKGMAFSHLATRGMGVVNRSVKITRILGRYPDKTAPDVRQKKPSSVLSFSPLPLGNAEHVADTMGLVAMLTPYLLVIVSTTPIAQTQYKTPRPKEVAAHGAMTGALAWFPSVKLKTRRAKTAEDASRTKLVYCWSNILTVLEIVEVEPSANGTKDEPPNLQFKPRSRWKAEEAIVGVQWLGRSVLAVLTNTQQLVILEDPSMLVTDSSDLIQKHIYHADLFSPQLNQLVDQLEDDEVAAMHGVVADAFYMSFKAYKGRLFLLGYNEVTFGTLSNWADRLLALMEDGSYIGAIELASAYYSGDANKVAVGLPEDDPQRHTVVQEKLLEMMSASLKYAFSKSIDEDENLQQLAELASACIKACISMDDTDFLFDDVYPWYQDSDVKSIFIEGLETHIVDDEMTIIPPVAVKDLVGHYTTRGLNSRLEEMICHLDSRSMDIDQITTLCKKNYLYDALLYVWNQALGDYVTILDDLLSMAEHQHITELDITQIERESKSTSASKVFPYLSYVLTGRIYPTGKDMSDDVSALAKAEIYQYFFSGNSTDSQSRPSQSPRSTKSSSKALNFKNLRKILNFDAPSFLSMLNEAFEDPYLNGPQDRMIDETLGQLSDEQKFGLSVNRQWIVSILLELMTAPNYEPDDIIYLDIFISRNLPKFPQFILLPGHILHRVLVGLCQYPTEDVFDDCQLSVEYLLSIYQPPDLTSLIPLIANARFFRVLKTIYKAEKQYAELLKTCFDDYNNPDAIFECIGDCLNPRSGLREIQVSEVRAVIVDHAYDLVAADVTEAASTIERFAPDLHTVLLEALDEDDIARYKYLRTILEPHLGEAEAETDSSKSRPRTFVEQYVRLLCNYDPSHVSVYIERLGSNDLRLDQVLPALEINGIVDAAVILLARVGKVREGIDRLTQHLSTLEAALLGILNHSNKSPDVPSTAEASRDIISGIRKYSRVGIWLCQRQSKASRPSEPSVSTSKSAKALHDVLTLDEELWLDLVDAVVAVVKNVTEVFEGQEPHPEPADAGSTNSTFDHFDPSKMITDLRAVVQETFTALLATTSVPHNKGTGQSDISFLRILRAFLSRASISSPPLSNLRAVLSTIFSAYSYEESLLSLANRLLDKDLFVHVAEADAFRRRGWRPIGQVCEGCSKRVWGPGAGGYIWDAWQCSNEDREARHKDRAITVASRSSSRSRAGNGKGKGVTRRHEQIPIPEDQAESGNSDASGEGEKGPVVIFSCRHMFHRACLEKMHDTGDGRQNTGGSPNFNCPLCR
ncbi:Vacuolar protein sorting-associated protein 8 [Puttea exsequens]|nr:Vacuolar protein sorting-associated protein 8 [Puttea exsequens]